MMLMFVMFKLMASSVEAACLCYAVDGGLIWSHLLLMSAKKVDAECRVLNKSWTAKYFF